MLTLTIARLYLFHAIRSHVDIGLVQLVCLFHVPVQQDDRRFPNREQNPEPMVPDIQANGRNLFPDRLNQWHPYIRIQHLDPHQGGPISFLSSLDNFLSQDRTGSFLAGVV